MGDGTPRGSKNHSVPAVFGITRILRHTLPFAGGDYTSCRRLRDAVGDGKDLLRLLSTRLPSAAAAPFKVMKSYGTYILRLTHS